MRLALVAMPWAPFNLPSAALGALAGYLRRHEPGVEVTCRSEFVTVWKRLGDSYGRLARMGHVGELIYASQLCPDRAPRVVELVAEAFEAHDRRAELRGEQPSGLPVDAGQISSILDMIGEHLAATGRELADGFDVVGLTTSFGQLLASLALARTIKSLCPEVTIVLGGTGSRRAPLDLLRECRFVDWIVCGEGELRLRQLLLHLGGDLTTHGLGPGVYGRTSLEDERQPACTHHAAAASAGVSEPRDLGDMAFPDYDEYAELADSSSIFWSLPIEGSRGCWWDRTEQTSDPLNACFFCGNSGAHRYRRKAPSQVETELAWLVNRYQLTRVLFVDCVVPHRGGVELAQALASGTPEYRFSIEIRASISSLELVELMEAGCFAVQIGVEGLSPSYLRRINKGTSVIRNLATMRACFELDLESGSNLLIGFPGATAAEVQETAECVLRFALPFKPLLIAPFKLDVDSSVYRVPERFGVSHIRNQEIFRQVLSGETYSRLPLPLLDYDADMAPVDWSSVEDACLQWRRLHQSLQTGSERGTISKPLIYLDGGTFLEIIDRRTGLRTITLEPPLREIYLECTEIRTARQLAQTFTGRCSETELLDEILPALVRENLMFAEDDRYLSLAVASRREIAAQRIRRMAAERRDRISSHPRSPVAMRA